jgi:predicted amidohydrolase
MRKFTAAAVQLAPAPGPLSSSAIKRNTDRCLTLVRECVENTGAELVVTPESVTTGFGPGCTADELWGLLDEPDTLTGAFSSVATELGVHICLGAYVRGERRGTVYNAAILIGPSAGVLGTYYKTHPFGPECSLNGGWVTPGSDVTVVTTPFGRIGMMICFDGDFPELSRIQAVMGAEIICRPAALLRSADLWELTSRARAYDNHVFIVGANATGVDVEGTPYFGNSHIVTPTGFVIARAASHEGWVAADLDPSTAMGALTPGSNIRQPFDHLRDRNLVLCAKYRDDLLRKAESRFVR